MKKSSPVSAETRRENLLCGIAAVLFPTAILCYFCAQNLSEFVELWLIYFMLGSIVVLAAFAYCASLLVLRRALLALTFCVVCWTGCYLEPAIVNAFFLDDQGVTIKHALVYVTLLILVVAVLASFLLRRLKRDMRKPAIFFSAFLVLILAFNLLQIVKAGLFVKTGLQTGEQLYRTDFYVDLGKNDTPNVYWIHPDGMMGVDMVEKYYHDEQTEYLSALAVRGFSVNVSAHFEAAKATGIGIAALTSPYAYDTWISDYLSTHEAAVQAQDNYSFWYMLQDVRLHNEMIAAFGQKGYSSNVISYDSGILYSPLPGDVFYSIRNNDKDERVIWRSEEDTEKFVLLQNINANAGQISLYLKMIFEKLLMTILTPPSQWFEGSILSGGIIQPFSTEMPEERLKQILPVKQPHYGNDWLDSKMVRSLYDILHGESQDPKLVVLHDLMPHGPFYYDEDGALSGHGASYEYVDYYPQHVFSAKVLVDMIDMILEVDPDAVIVIQADHGAKHTERDFKAVFGEDADAATLIEIWNSTMSAIRVPDKYQTGEEHFAMENPLNLSRYLVNSFVGKNYEYLPPN